MATAAVQGKPRVSIAQAKTQAAIRHDLEVVETHHPGAMLSLMNTDASLLKAADNALIKKLPIKLKSGSGETEVSSSARWEGRLHCQ